MYGNTMASSSINTTDDIESALLCIPEDQTGPMRSIRPTFLPTYNNSNDPTGIPPKLHSPEPIWEFRTKSRVLSRRQSLSLPTIAREHEDGLAFKNASLHNLRRSVDNSDIDTSGSNVGLNISNHSHVLPAVDEIHEFDTGSTNIDILSPDDSHETHQFVQDGDETDSVISMTPSTNSLRSSLGGMVDGLRRRVSLDNIRKRPNKRSENDPQTGSSFHAPSYSFLAKDDSKAKVSVQVGHRWWRGIFFVSLLSIVACIITLWAPYPIGARRPSEMVAQYPWSNGCKGLQSCICPRETICADDLMSMIFLTIARASAWFDYPLYMILFLSKARNLNNFLQKTILKCWVNFSDYHRVHALFGIIVGIESTSHGFFHILRWARRKDDIQLLWTHQTGITGLVALLLGWLIVLPMAVPFLKNKISFEWRKGLHYLSIVWGACLMYHAPQRIYWLIGTPLVIYVADHLFGLFHKTNLVENAYFERLGDSSCVVTFENPPSFGKQNSAYVYLMLPWLSKYQFHAFSVYPSNKPNHSQLCISSAGGWTASMMKEISTPTHKPAFIVGPYLSPFSSPAMDCENLIAVASGIGITPAISLIKNYTCTRRRLNLIWICRDPGLVEYFLNTYTSSFDFGDQGYTLIYYTGTRLLVIEKNLPPNIFIYRGRPNLARALSGIISSISSGQGLPWSGTNQGIKSITETPPELRARALLEKALSIYSTDQLFQYALEVSNNISTDLELEILVDAVDFRGVLGLMQQLLKDNYRFIKDKLLQTFEQFNSVAPHLLSRTEFKAFMDLMLEQGKDGFEPATVLSAKHDVLFHPETHSLGVLEPKHDRRPPMNEFMIKQYLRGSHFSAKKWSLLYCGGSAPVLEELKEYRRQFGIGLAVEKFDF